MQKIEQATLSLAQDFNTNTDDQILNEIVQIEDQAPHLIGERFAIIKQRNPKDWLDKCTAFCESIGKKPWTLNYINKVIRYSDFIENVFGTKVPKEIPKEINVRPLTALPPEDQKEIWEEVKEDPKPERIKQARKKYDTQQAQPKTKKGQPTKLVFNFTSDMVDWARWTWNPVFGCKHGCQYCYAADFAKRQGRDFQKPEMLMHKLSCPKNTVIPDKEKKTPGINNVFVCSMSDLFGEWVPDEWIQKVFNACRDNPQWNYIFLTKNPKRLARYKWEDNWWVGTTVDCQKRVEMAETAFRGLEAAVRFVSLEPFNEKITFSDISVFNWLIIGGRSRSSGMPAFQPQLEWVGKIIGQARESNIPVYCKPNLQPLFPKEWPS